MMEEIAALIMENKDNIVKSSKNSKGKIKSKAVDINAVVDEDE